MLSKVLECIVVCRYLHVPVRAKNGIALLPCIYGPTSVKVENDKTIMVSVKWTCLRVVSHHSVKNAFIRMMYAKRDNVYLTSPADLISYSL